MKSKPKDISPEILIFHLLGTRGWIKYGNYEFI